MSIVMQKSTHEEHLSQPLQTNNKQFRRAVTFLTAYNGKFNITNSNNHFQFEKSIIDGDFIGITLPPGAYEIESLNKEIKRTIVDQGHFTETNYPFLIKPNFLTLGSIIEIRPQGSVISFAAGDSVRNILGFHETLLYKEYNLSDNPVDILSFDIVFVHTNIAKGIIFHGRRFGIIHNFTMDAAPGDKYIKKVKGGVLWYMMDAKLVFSRISFKLKNENNELVSFNGQSISFRLSIKVI